MKSKRFAALFLAVMLVLTSLPFSVFAAENTGIEETGAEENTSSSITISDSSGDVPVLYAQDPFSEIKNRAEGGSNDMTQYGVTRAKIVSHLESHEHDDFYLGTPYQGGDWQSPNGDTSYNGSAGMNCTGFVSYVLRACGLNTGTFLEQLSLTGSTVWAGSGLPYDLMSGASNYLNAVQNGDIAAYTFRDKSELLASGLAQKGDIILMWWSLSPFDDGADNHIGFFWGDSSSEDKMWHSSTHPQSGNQISEIVPKTPGSYFILIKTENEEPTYSVTLTKTSADATVTQGNAAYSLAGATYNVYKGTTASGTVVATFTTDSSGHATINPPLENGTYAVKETKAPPGYKLDPETHVITINGSDTTINVQDDPGRMAIKVVKKDVETGTTAQGNASLAGAVYRVSYQLGGQTVTKEITSNADGTFPMITDIPFGTVTIQEVTAPPGYKLDTEIHTYYIDGSQMVTDTYELVPDDITEEVQRGGLTIQKKDSQTGTTPQGDASLAGISFEIVNESQNAVVVGGRTIQPGQVATTITTNASGVATTGANALPYGDYTVRESATNDSMLLTFTEEISVTIDEDGEMLEYEAEDDVVRGGITVTKQDSQTGSTPQGNASFAGIDFEVINRSANPVVVGGQTYAVGEVVMTITTDESGTASTGNDALPYGTYEVRESQTNESMLLTWTGETVTVRQNGHSVAITAVNDVERGGLSLQKTDTITGTTPQGDADFEGITFQIINNSRNPVIVEGQKYQPGEVVKTLVTDAEGKASTSDDLLPYGEYILHESATNESMLNTVPDQTVLIEDDGVIYEFTCPNEVVRGDVLIEKRDLESGLLTPLGGASLDGTLFEITNKSKNAVYVNGALYAPGEVCATIEVKDGIAQTENRALPYGTYEMQEVKPGEGYLHTDQAVRHFTIRQDGQVVEYRDGDAAYNQVIRGDLQFVKVGEGGEANMGRFANVAFKLISETTGETHIVVTDENGEVRTTTEWNPHSQNTNGNDGVEDEAAWDDHAGTWFGLTTEGWMVETQDGLCALPYDTYTIEELRCSGNQGYDLVRVEHVTISRNNTTIYLGTLDDQFEGVPEIGTTALVDGEHTAAPAGEVTITDTVEYKNLKVGETYKISGVLMDKETGEPLLVGEGEEQAQVTAEVEFTPTSAQGTVELTYTFDASALAGKAVVVFEDLYQGENVVASHADINDEGQTVTFGKPSIGTTATIDGEKTAEPAEQITITDTVEYSGLTVGQEYKLTGVLMDKETGEPLLIGEGEEQAQVTSEATFTPSEPNGTIDVLFTFDSSALLGKSVVVFETLYQGENEVTAHTDIEDEGQTVTFVEGPKIGTTATVDGSHTASPVGEVTIVDEVAYSGLTPGKTYKISGVLMDKETGEPLLVGEGEEQAQVTAEVEFTPEAAEGTVELTYTLDASALAGKSVVVFETLYLDDVEITSHADIEDENQTVTFGEGPQIGTTATVNGQHTADPTGEVTIIDEVAYSGLTPGETYKISGVLMDKATGEPLLVGEEQAQITAEVEFTPEAESGTVQLSYTFDATSMAGKAVVVFEHLYLGELEIATHADIEDEGQTVTFGVPEIGTTATVNGAHTAEPAEQVTIVDTVTYSGLTPGKTYKLSGVLMDQATGEPLLVDGKEITAETEFTPEASSGTVELSYTLNASTLAGKSVVVFEDLYLDGVKVATHADITDAGQTVTFVEPDKPMISTMATVDDEQIAMPVGDITLTDIISYYQLTPGKEYTLKGVLMDQATEKPLTIDGKQVTSEVTFTPTESSGTVEVTFTFPADTLANTKVVVYEYLYLDGKEVATHTDINNKCQTITFGDTPSIGTTATVDGEKTAKPSEELTITDTVEYSGLIPGKTYKLSGVLMDKETEEPLLVDDKEVTSEVEFVAEKESGTVEMTFTLDASALVGKHIVVFETLYYNDKEIAAHTDIEDEDQTVLIDLNGRIFATKVDTDGAPVEGVVFGLFTADTTDFTEKNAAATAQTGADGKFEFDNVPAGEWLIVELVARPGYVLDSEPIEVTVDAEEIDLGEIVNEYTRISIIKTDATTGEQLAGATLELYDPDGTLIDTWVSNGQPHQITKLAVGDGYVLKEVSAPTGYKIADRITFSVSSTGEVQTIEMQDHPRDIVDVPKTGQTTPPMFIYAGVLVLAVALGVGFVVYYKKKKTSR
ncbi:VaFE repeat-containing surface-anchored protein [Acutalibacter sp. LFL-21]|uniref:VaFE repeat-containing surface-anchored protein n=1 Tax=Acutalibacter sp. LFL-21 TaxID=2983399 RepID=UPI0021D68B78|nr:VaFE repeat-containing surface-anchored protein [Acutalibacter sp. LFL-21]MCU7653329.1 VaFE repeat-containing surface-anchored protein [Acutalibacter sp. LFL-21]